MKLLITPTSPFARKARIIALEKQLPCETETDMPFGENPKVLAHNRLRKIPVLLADDGAAVFDSPVICEYLDSLAAPRFFPAEPAARAEAKTREALADGATESIAAVIMAKRVEPNISGPQWEKWLMDKAAGAFAQFAEAMQKKPRSGKEFADIGDIALFCALDFALFRAPELKWRETHPVLAQWFDEIASRDSAKQTDPRQ